MKKRKPFLFTCLLLALAVALCLVHPTGHKEAFPKDLSISLNLPASAVVGDHVTFDFVIKNTGATNFEIWDDFGIHVQVKDERGNNVPAPNDNLVVSSGNVMSITLRPGDIKSIPYDLDRYACVTEPGNFVVTAWHDLGRKIDVAHPPPAATARIQIKRPTAEYAVSRVGALCQETTVWEDRERLWELQHLWDTAYLPALCTEAKAGHFPACFGIGSIKSVEANGALLELAQTEEPKVARAAATVLIRRVPPLFDPTILNYFYGGTQTLPEAKFQTWRPQFDGPLLALAEKFLRNELRPLTGKAEADSILSFLYSQEASPSALGARIVELRGGLAQIDALLSSLQRALNTQIDPHSGMQAADSEATPPLYWLIQAIDALRHRGWKIANSSALETNPALAGEAGLFVFLRQLADPRIPKPMEGSWRNLVRAHLNDTSPIIRESAVKAIPLPLADGWYPQVRAALCDPDRSVVMNACQVASDSGYKSFVGPLALVVESVRSPFASTTRYEATVAAQHLGGGFRLWMAWCHLIPDPAITDEAVIRLSFETIDLPFNGRYDNMGVDCTPMQRKFMKDAWEVFLRKNRALLERGKRVPRNDPSITPALTGLNFSKTPIITIGLKDGTNWPVANPYSQ